MKLIILLILTSCFREEKEKEVPIVYTQLQKAAVDTMPLVQQAYMQDCFFRNKYSFSSCLKDASRLGIPECKNQDKGIGVGAVAVGSALGVGAAKLLLGK